MRNRGGLGRRSGLQPQEERLTRPSDAHSLVTSWGWLTASVNKSGADATQPVIRPSTSLNDARQSAGFACRCDRPLPERWWQQRIERRRGHRGGVNQRAELLCQERHRVAFDGNACIRLLKNKDASEQHRVAAAENLMRFPTPEAADALWEISTDRSEREGLREEAAGSLGTLWIEVGIDYSRLVRLPDSLLSEVVADFDLAAVAI